MSEELKQCPFCGGHADLVQRVGGYSVDCRLVFDAVCPGENPGTDLFHDAETAIAEWNTRPIEDALRAERDAAIDELTTRRENFETMSHRLIAAESENSRMSAALELFADDDNYDIGGDWKREGLHPIDIASNALGKVQP